MNVAGSTDYTPVDSGRNDIHRLSNGSYSNQVSVVEPQSGTQTTGENVKDAACFSEKQRKILFGIFIVIGIAISWVSGTQFAKETNDGKFWAPFFFVWFCTCWMVVCFPIHVAIVVLRSCLGRPDPIIQLRDCAKVYGEAGMTLVSLCTRCLLFCILWVGVNYMYVYALGIILPTDVTALFSSNAAFVYLLSWIVLHEQFVSIRLLAVIVSVSGVVLLAYSDGLGGGSAWGVVLALGAALGSATYQVFFKKLVGDANVGQVSLFLTMLGLCNLLLLWPITLIINLSGAEDFGLQDIPWPQLTGSAGLLLVFNFLINFGVAFTYPTFIAVGTVLGIPLSAGEKKEGAPVPSTRCN